MLQDEKKYIGQECYIIHSSKSLLISAEGKIQISLTPTEYHILSIFIDNVNREIYLDRLATCLWGEEYEKDYKSLIPTISRIRSKLNKIRPGLGACIETNHGYGSYTLVFDQCDNNSHNYTENDCLRKVDQFLEGYLNSILYCPFKWGPFTYDEIQQNTNICEGALAIVSLNRKDKYNEIIEETIETLINEITDVGLSSKSLGVETVVPTAMFICLYEKIYNDINEKVRIVCDNLWKARSNNGWGIYVKSMRKHANIGCTYWALYGLKEVSFIPKEDFQRYIKSLFKYENTYTFGKNISEVNPRMPYLYATSMMYIIYNMLSDESKKQVGTNYNPKKAVEFIVKSFDNPFYLSESEGIDGVEIDGKLSVHTVNWNHMTIDYSLTAMSIAISSNLIEREVILDILNRICKMLIEYSVKDGNRFYWCSPNMILERESRGKMIFPTMHIVMGLSNIRKSINDYFEKDGGEISC